MWLAQLPLVALAAEPALRATQVRWLAESDEPVWPRVLQANLTTTGTTMTTTEGNLTVVAPREITQEETLDSCPLAREKGRAKDHGRGLRWGGPAATRRGVEIHFCA